MKNFALIGCAGFVAPRHMKAIKETGNRLVAAIDPHDSVGILDRYSYETRYFQEFERFDRHVEKLRRGKSTDQIHYVSICSPNYLHDAHIRFALRVGAHAICEKPLVLNPWNLDPLQELEVESRCRVSTILQLRVHPSLIELRQSLSTQDQSIKHQVVLTYITSRGSWYLHSWKGSAERSGGLATNIGIHFFDLLIWLFGPLQGMEVHIADPRRTSGYLALSRASVRWYLSIDPRDLERSQRNSGQTTYRSITIDGKEVEFSEGFVDLHTVLYQEILAGRGFGIEDARPSITLAHQLRNSQPVGINELSHEMARS